MSKLLRVDLGCLFVEFTFCKQYKTFWLILRSFQYSNIIENHSKHSLFRTDLYSLLNKCLHEKLHSSHKTINGVLETLYKLQKLFFAYKSQVIFWTTLLHFSVIIIKFYIHVQNKIK